LTFVYRFIV